MHIPIKTDYDGCLRVEARTTNKKVSRIVRFKQIVIIHRETYENRI